MGLGVWPGEAPSAGSIWMDVATILPPDPCWPMTRTRTPGRRSSRPAAAVLWMEVSWLRVT